jgi:hypothetical protein
LTAGSSWPGEGLSISVVSFVLFVSFTPLDEVAGAQGRTDIGHCSNTAPDLPPRLVGRDVIAIGVAAYDNPVCP